MSSAPTLHHLALFARDVASLSAFYRDVLGLPEVARHHYEDGSLRSVWLGLGPAAVLMIEPSPKPQAPDEPPASGGCAEPTARERGLGLLALRIAETERGAWEERLTAGGAPIEQRTAATSYARDPEGNRIAVSSYALPLPDEATRPRAADRSP